MGAGAAPARATRRSRRSAASRPPRRPRRPAGIRPTSSEPTTSAPRAAASASIRATISCSAAASQSSTFIETWTTPARGRSRPSARTPGKPPPVSRTTAAIAFARLELAAQVDVERDQRPARADDHPAGALVEPRRARSRAPARPRRSAAAARPARRGGRTPARGPARARRRGTRAARAPRRSARASTRAVAFARSRSSGRIGTIGTTSAAPIRGWAPSCRRRSIRSRAHATPASSVSTSSSASPTSVKTDRWWSASTWTSSSRAGAESAARAPRSTARSRPSEKFGTASSTARTLGA